MNHASNERVLWAIQFSPELKSLRNSGYQAITQFLKNSDVSIEPVVVIQEWQLELNEGSRGREADEYVLNVEALLAKQLSKLKDPRLLPPKLLVKSHSSYRAGVDVLLDYAQSSHAKAIVVLTHNKKALARMFVGSFAETLMLKSPVPLFIVNPKSKAKKIARILFPTDLSEASRSAFEKLLPEAKRLGAKIHLYYKFEYLIPETVTAIEISPRYASYLEQDAEEKAHLLSDWVASAKSKGVSCESEVDRSALYIPDGIQRAAKKYKADLIAMASHSGHLATLLIGSIARNVIRGANVPVWVIHPTPLTAAQPRPKAKESKAVAQLRTSSR